MFGYIIRFISDKLTFNKFKDIIINKHKILMANI